MRNQKIRSEEQSGQCKRLNEVVALHQLDIRERRTLGIPVGRELQ